MFLFLLLLILTALYRHLYRQTPREHQHLAITDVVENLDSRGQWVATQKKSVNFKEFYFLNNFFLFTF